ncbi:hypothetical protein J31TS3_36260 [Paenibacillus lactis]|nr:hypothetical protein J31TS3_36260 [Paenibacillus lactis]
MTFVKCINSRSIDSISKGEASSWEAAICKQGSIGGIGSPEPLGEEPGNGDGGSEDRKEHRQTIRDE